MALMLKIAGGILLATIILALIALVGSVPVVTP